MEALVNTTTTRRVQFLDLGVPATGGTITYSLVGPTGTTLVSAQAATDAGGGWYTYALDGTTHLSTVGLYHEVWAGTAGTDRYFADTFQVGYGNFPLVTRLDLRHMIAQELRDLWTGQATGGSSSTLLDTNRVEPDNHWRGASLYIYGGTGEGQTRNVSSSTESSGTLTVGKNFGTTPDTTSRYELHKEFETDEYNRAINQAIWTTAKRALIPVIDETLTQTDSVYEYLVPAGLYCVAQVWTRDETDAASPTDWTRLDLYNKDFEIIAGRRILRIKSPADNTRMRLLAQMCPDQLKRDSSFCDISPQYLTFAACASLCRSNILSASQDTGAWGQRAQHYEGLSQMHKPAQFPQPGSFRL